MRDELMNPSGRVERRFLHALSSSGGVVQKRADVMVGRASRTVRRGSFVLALGWLGLLFFAAGWVMFNLAMHGLVSARWSVVTAHFVAMGINLLGGSLLMLVAARLAPTVEKKLHGSRRPSSARDGARSQLLDAQGQPSRLSDPCPPPDSVEGALGAAIELGVLAAETIPQIIRAFHKPKRASEPKP